jgi:hypothetical protein
MVEVKQLRRIMCCDVCSKANEGPRNVGRFVFILQVVASCTQTWPTRVKTNNLFPVDIDRLEQGCVAPSEQVVNNVVAALSIVVTSCQQCCCSIEQL